MALDEKFDIFSYPKPFQFVVFYLLSLLLVVATIFLGLYFLKNPNLQNAMLFFLTLFLVSADIFYQLSFPERITLTEKTIVLENVLLKRKREVPYPNLISIKKIKWGFPAQTGALFPYGRRDAFQVNYRWGKKDIFWFIFTKDMLNADILSHDILRGLKSAVSSKGG